MTSRLRSTFARLVARRDDYGVALVLIVVTILTLALANDAAFGREVAGILGGFTLLFILHTSGVGHRAMVATTLVVVISIVGVILATVGLSRSFGDGAAVMTNLALAIAAPVVILLHITRSPMVTFRLVLGALCVYLFIGLAFAYVYGLLKITSGQPFFVQMADATPGDYLYFSFTTLTTVGFGDLTAADPPGRMASVTEAMVGQLYLVSAVAILVSRIGQRMTGDDTEPPATQNERYG